MRATNLLLQSLVVGFSVASLDLRAVQKRDIATVQGAFVNVQAAASTLATVVRSLNGSPSNKGLFVSAASGVESALAQARVAVAPTTNVALGDAPTLQSTADSLASTVKIAVMDMILQKPMLDQMGLTGAAMQTLQNQKALAGALGGVVLAKIPAEGIGGAQTAFGGAAGSLDIGLSFLSGQMAPAAAAAGGGGGAAAPAAAAAAAGNKTIAATTEKRAKRVGRLGMM